MSRTGWRPNDARERWPDPKRDYRHPSQTFRRSQPDWLILWAWFQFAVLLLTVAYTLANLELLSLEAKTGLLLAILAGVAANSQQLMLSPSPLAEVLRAGLLAAIAVHEVTAFTFWGVWLLPLQLIVCLLSTAISWRLRSPAFRASPEFNA